ncbi:MAG: hypothetical protein AABX01_03880 [Candidatus Micrarchaeota archaeon]
MEATKSLFLEAFGDSPYLRVLDHFLTFPGWDYSKSQVAKDADVSRVTIEWIWRKLLELEFIEKTRTIGRAEMYRLNQKNPQIRLLQEFDFNLAKLYADSLEPQKERIAVRRK